MFLRKSKRKGNFQSKSFIVMLTLLMTVIVASCNSETINLNSEKVKFDDVSVSEKIETPKEVSENEESLAEETKPVSELEESVTTTKDDLSKLNLIEATVLKVTDGDTIKVEFGGKKESIRLLLVDTPESVHPNIPEPQPFAIEASDFAKETIKVGSKVKLELDVSERDKYGRILAYVWVGDKMFNELLLEKGYARIAYIFAPNTKYADRFREVQVKAQKAGVGIWSIENYAQEDGFHEESASGSDVQTDGIIKYANCTTVREAGKAPLHKGDPGYSTKLDRDGDGVACE